MRINDVIGLGAVAYALYQNNALQAEFADQLEAYKAEVDDVLYEALEEMDREITDISDKVDQKTAQHDIEMSFLFSCGGIADTIWNAKYEITLRNTSSEIPYFINQIVIDNITVAGQVSQYQPWQRGDWKLYPGKTLTIELTGKPSGGASQDRCLFESKGSRKAIREAVKKAAGRKLLSRCSGTELSAEGNVKLWLYSEGTILAQDFDFFNIPGTFHFKSAQRAKSIGRSYDDTNSRYKLMPYAKN